MVQLGCYGWIFLAINLFLSYMNFHHTCFSSLIPQSTSVLVLPGPVQTIVTRRNIRTMSDEELTVMFRIQQLFNKLANEIFESICVSCHQVAFMIILTGLSFVVLRFYDTLAPNEPLVLLICIMGIAVGMLILVVECSKFEDIMNTSDNVKKSSLRMSGRKSLLRKFTVSCPPMYLEAAYPFYKIKRETLPQFLEQYCDFLVELLMI